MAPLSDLSLMTPVIATINHLLVQEPWARQQLAVHGWVYSLKDGRVHHLGMDIDSPASLAEKYEPALARIRADRQNR